MGARSPRATRPVPTDPIHIPSILDESPLAVENCLTCGKLWPAREWVGEELRGKRQAAELRAEDIAAHMKFSKSYVKQLEQGIRPWTSALIRAYERAVYELSELKQDR